MITSLLIEFSSCFTTFYVLMLDLDIYWLANGEYHCIYTLSERNDHLVSVEAHPLIHSMNYLTQITFNYQNQMTFNL